MKPCEICGNLENNRPHRARDLGFGTGAEFDYVECAACGCVQIETIPENMAEHYPSVYYAYNSYWTPPNPPFKAWLKHQRAKYIMTGTGLVGKFLASRWPADVYHGWLKRGGVTFDSRVLDVGCGGGEVLHMMTKDGFRHVTGLDPYIEKDRHYPGCTIYQRSVLDHTGRYDFIMVNHAFEHMDEPLRHMRKFNELLDPGKVLLLRIPVADSYAWRTDGVFWYGLDAPRHFFIHTRKSIRHLAAQTGFEVESVICDSGGAQFWGTEQNRRGIPYYSPESYQNRQDQSIWTKQQIAEFRRKGQELNARDEGDTACFYLRKKAEL